MPPQGLPRLFARAVELREVLVLDVTGLVKRHLMSGDPLSELRGVVGYANVASDLRVLANIYQANWSAIAGKTAVQSAELNEAAALFRQITQAIAARAEQPAVVSAASLERQRAFTLLVRAYEDARRAITYLRSAEGDADKLAPSMWARRNRRPASNASDSEGHDNDAPNAAPSAEPAASPAPKAPVAPGMPGGSPFIERLSTRTNPQTQPKHPIPTPPIPKHPNPAPKPQPPSPKPRAEPHPPPLARDAGTR